MKHRAWFTLAVRLIGLMTLVEYAPGPIQFILNHLVLGPKQTIGSAPGEPSFRQDLWTHSGSFVACGAALYLLFGARRLINWCLRRVDGVCPACGYEMRSVHGEKCPECGTFLIREDGEKPLGHS